MGSRPSSSWNWREPESACWVTKIPPGRRTRRTSVGDEALVAVHDQIERAVPEGEPSAGLTEMLGDVVDRALIVDDADPEGLQSSRRDGDVRWPALRRDHAGRAP